MDNRRLFILAALAIVGYMIFNAWMQDYPPVAPKPQTTTQTQVAPAAQKATAKTASKKTSQPQPAATSTTQKPGAAAKIPLVHGKNITITTDTLHVTIDTAGGTIRSVKFPQYPQTEKPDSPPVELLSPAPEHRLVLQTGLRGLGAANQPPIFKAKATHYTLKPNQKVLTVPLTWQHDGVTVTKVYTFHRGSYQVGLNYRVSNADGSVVSVVPYVQFRIYHVHHNTSFFSKSTFSISRYTYSGPAFFDGNDYNKLNYEDLAKKPFTDKASGGWTAMVNQYFLAAVIPPQKLTAKYYANQIAAKHFRSGFTLPQLSIAAGQTRKLAFHLFLGPKLQNKLGSVAPGLNRTVDYGKVTIIAQPMFKALGLINSVVGNWGWSILLLVFLLKLILFPLFQKSGRSMAKMREFQPRIKAIQKRYKEDRQRQSQAMMELYKKEKINPLGGCLPMVLYLPVYFGLYYVLIYSVELRHAPFIFWLTDLSAPDPLYILPILYGIANFCQMRVNPKPADKLQARIMMIMPLGVVAFALIMPSGLVLYWLANAVLTTLQQWHINRDIHRSKVKQHR